MSRTAFGFAAALLAAPHAAHAQDIVAEIEAEEDEEELTAEAVLADSEEVVGPPIPDDCRSDPLNNSVTICAPREDEKFRVPRRIDPSRVDDFGDVPRAPNAFGIPDHGIPIRFGYAPPPVVIIDLEAIPEAPPGSDADRVARGLAPRGRDDGAGAVIVEPDNAPTPEEASPQPEG